MSESGVLPGTVPSQPAGQRPALVATACTDGCVDLWNPVTGRPVGESLTGHDGPVLGVAFSGDGRLLASAGRDGTVRLWDPATARPVGAPLATHAEAVEAVAFAGDSIVVSAGREGTIRLRDPRTGRPERKPLRHSRGLLQTALGIDWIAPKINGVPSNAFDSDMRRVRGIRSAAVSADGRVLASGGYDGTVRVWDLMAMRRIGGRFSAHQTTSAVALSPDGRLLATGGAEGRVRLWDTTARCEADPELTAPRDPVIALAFSPDGKILAAGNAYHGGTRLWDTTSGALLPGPPGDGGVRGLAFSADGRLLAIATDGSTAKLWDMTSGQYSGSPLYRADPHPEGHGHTLYGIAVTGSIAPSSLPPPGPVYTEPGPHPLTSPPPEQPYGVNRPIRRR